MPEAKCPYFSSVNPIIPKGSYFMLREKVATWSSNVGPVQLLFSLYVKPNGGEEGRVGRWQLMAQILWYRRWGYTVLAYQATGEHTSAFVSTALHGCAPAATQECEPECWNISAVSHKGLVEWLESPTTGSPRSRRAPGTGHVQDGTTVSLDPFAATAKRRGSDPVNRTKQQHSFCFLSQV